jgi:hypothetical protein
VADWLHQNHPLRLQYDWFTDANPLMASVSRMAQWVTENRKPVAADNPFLAMQKTMSDGIISGLDAWRDARDAWSEKMFFAIYGSPALQAALGIDSAGGRSGQHAPKSALHKELIRSRIAELRSRIPVGGLREAAIRALLYAGMSRQAVDERGFESIRRIRSAQADMPALALPDFKALVREQFYMLWIDEDACLAAIPSMLPADPAVRMKVFSLVKEILEARGKLTAEDTERLNRLAQVFGMDGKGESFRNLAAVPPAWDETMVKAS